MRKEDAIIYLKISKESKKFKQKKKGKAQANSLERKFLKEMVERELDKLERSAMKKFIVDYILLTQDLINQYSSLGVCNINQVKEKKAKFSDQ